MDNATQTLHSRVRATFEASGLALNSLAEAAGIPRTTLRRKLAGVAEFTFSELIRLAYVLDTTIEAWTAGLDEIAAA